MDTQTKETRATVRVTAMVEPSLADRLTQAAFRNERSIAAEVRVALRDHLLREYER